MTTMDVRRCSQIIMFSLMFGLTLASFSVEDCKTLGFNKPNLLCSTCKVFNRFQLDDACNKCKECCMKDYIDGALGLKRYSKAVLEVCTCKFGAYPQIQAFIKSDRPSKYINLQIKFVRGLDPVIKLYDADNILKDELDIHKWTTDSVDEFFQTHLVMESID